MTSKRQVTFPRQVVERLNLKEGDALQVVETNDGILIKPHRFSAGKLATLRHKIATDLPGPDYEAIRHATLDPKLRS